MTRIPLSSIGDILKGIIQEKKWQDRFRAQAIWDHWDEVVGDVVAKEAQPRGFRQGCLLVDVSDPMWMHHLQFSQEVIRKNLNSKIGLELVKNIRFTFNSSIHIRTASPENTGDPDHK